MSHRLSSAIHFLSSRFLTFNQLVSISSPRFKPIQAEAAGSPKTPVKSPIRSTSTALLPKISPKNPKLPPAPGAKPQPWSAADKIVLLNIASKRGASIKTFEGALKGRSGLACYIRWKHVILRELRKSFEEEMKREERAKKIAKARERRELAKKKAIKVECD